MLRGLIRARGMEATLKLARRRRIECYCNSHIMNLLKQAISQSWIALQSELQLMCNHWRSLFNGAALIRFASWLSLAHS
jgi:hypothetical protein